MPQEHVGVAPGAVDIGDKRIEPYDTRGFHRVGSVDDDVPCQGAGKEMQAEVEPAARLQQVLYLLVALGAAETLVEVDKDEFGNAHTCGAGNLTAYEFGDKSLCTVASPTELKHIFKAVVGVDKRRK